MAWTPTETLLNTVREFDNFSHSISYIHVEEAVQTPCTVSIVATSPTDTVTITNGITATISGFYRYMFYDTLVYRDFNDTIKTLQGNATQGTWEQFDINDCYQVVNFTPDTTRYRQFTYTATATHPTTQLVVATQTYTIDLSDKNWTPGMMALQNAVAQIRARGN